jgi:adenylate kinase
MAYSSSRVAVSIRQTLFYITAQLAKDMKLIIFGPQASGKGTQAVMLAKELGLAHISSGERLRQEVASGSALGQKMREHMDRGELVPTDLLQAMIKRAIHESHGKFILDGFPRTAEQAEWLDMQTPIDHVIVLTIRDKTAVERIGGRRECPKGHGFNVATKPPRHEGLCDECGLPLHQRSDDTAAAVMKRLQIYHSQTAPLIEHYKEKVVTVDGEPDIAEVHFAVLKALHHR